MAEKRLQVHAARAYVYVGGDNIKPGVHVVWTMRHGAVQNSNISIEYIMRSKKARENSGMCVR